MIDLAERIRRKLEDHEETAFLNAIEDLEGDDVEVQRGVRAKVDADRRAYFREVEAMLVEYLAPVQELIEYVEKDDRAVPSGMVARIEAMDPTRSVGDAKTDG